MLLPYPPPVLSASWFYCTLRLPPRVSSPAALHVCSFIFRFFSFAQLRRRSPQEWPPKSCALKLAAVLPQTDQGSTDRCVWAGTHVPSLLAARADCVSWFAKKSFQTMKRCALSSDLPSQPFCWPAPLPMRVLNPRHLLAQHLFAAPVLYATLKRHGSPYVCGRTAAGCCWRLYRAEGTLPW